MKKHITQAAINELAVEYKRTYDCAQQARLFGNDLAVDQEYMRLTGLTDAFGILTGQDYDTARMMLRKRADIA